MVLRADRRIGVAPTGAPRSVRPAARPPCSGHSASRRCRRRAPLRRRRRPGRFLVLPARIAHPRRRPAGPQHHPGASRPAARHPRRRARRPRCCSSIRRPTTAGSRSGKPGSALQPGKRIALGRRRRGRDGRGAAPTAIAGCASSARRRRRRSRGFGRLPLPPYITRDPTAADEQRYQTVYARARGQRRRADGRAPLHRRAARRARGQGRPGRGARPRRWDPAPSSRSRSDDPRRAPDASRSATRSPRGWRG